MTHDALEAAYRHCLALARRHYENFPVASWILPRHLRRPVAVIYAFARTADDFADEGDMTPEQRLRKLHAYDTALHALRAREPVGDPLFLAVGDVIRRHNLPFQPFHDLISAFSQDVTRKRYANFLEVMDYCRRSANPVGRLLLHLYRQASPQNLQRSDAICSALQLINFLQDIRQDYDENGRIYLPQDEMAQHGVTEEHLRNGVTDAAMQALMNLQILRARAMLLTGAPLGQALPGRIGFELRLVIQGGLGVLDALEKQCAVDVYARPRLRRTDWLRMLWRALLKRPVRPKK